MLDRNLGEKVFLGRPLIEVARAYQFPDGSRLVIDGGIDRICVTPRNQYILTKDRMFVVPNGFNYIEVEIAGVEYESRNSGNEGHDAEADDAEGTGGDAEERPEVDPGL